MDRRNVESMTACFIGRHLRWRIDCHTARPPLGRSIVEVRQTWLWWTATAG